MIDSEVVRLRQLRGTALRARALAAAMESSGSRRNTVFTRSAVSCWRIARIVTGRLRAHPYLSYQRDASPIDAMYFRLAARLTVVASQRRDKSLQTLSVELKRVARELDNARALTWSADLSDTFGRLQIEIRLLIKEAGAGARKQSGSLNDAAARAETGVNAARNTDGSLEANWPYLAF
jgi:hypothetical protein